MIELLKVLFSKKKTIAIITLAGFIVSAAVSLVIPPRYTSQAMFMPLGIEKEITGMEGFFSQFGSFGESLSEYIRARKNYIIELILRSRRMSQLMNERFGLEDIYGVKGLDMVREKLREKTGVYIRNEGVIELTVEDSDPERAFEISRSYIEFLDSTLIGLNMMYANEKVKFLKSEIVKREAVIASLDSSLAEFQREYGLFDISKQAKAMVDIVSALMSRLALLDIEKKLLGMMLKPDMKEFEKVNAQIGAIEDELRLIKEGSSEERNQLIPPLDKLPELSRDYIEIVSKIKMEEFVLAYLRMNLEDAIITANSRISVIKVIDPPFVPQRRSWPKRKQIVLVSTLASLLWACFFMLLVDEIKKGNLLNRIRSIYGEDG